MPAIAPDLEVKLGETLEATLTLTNANGEAINLTGSTVEVVLESYNLGENPPVALKSGSGLTVTEPTKGVLTIKQAIEESKFIVGLGHWYAKVTTAAGSPSFPQSGRFIVGAA